jgi:cell division septal protein FtsQ
VVRVPARRRPTARTAVLPARRPLPEVRSLLPTGKSLLIALAIIAAAAGAYFMARETSLFAVRSLDVRGGTPAIRAQVRAALAPELGKSLLKVGGGDLGQRLAPVTGVRSFRFDRHFPNTLEVTLTAERPVLVVRQGPAAYLVSASGRVVRTLTHPRQSNLPRLWLPTKATKPVVGSELPGLSLPAAIAVAPLASAPLPGGVKTVQSDGDQLTLVLGSGFEVRLGDVGDLRLKLAIARRILRLTFAATGSGYIDVSVPERPVLSSNSRVGG